MLVATIVVLDVDVDVVLLVELVELVVAAVEGVVASSVTATVGVGASSPWTLL